MPANEISFPFSDSVAGYVESHDAGLLRVRTSDRRLFEIRVDRGASAEMLRNLGEPYRDVTDRLTTLLEPGRYLFAYGIFYPEADQLAFEAKHVVLVGEQPGRYRFEEPDWWTRQLHQLAEFYRRSQFGTGPVDYRDYRTALRLDGAKAGHHVQETDTISRLVYGMATAYLLGGDEAHLDAAERGTEYLREHMRFVDTDHDVVYWYHGIDVGGARETKLFTSEFGDDYDAVPLYEQIYALAGPVQTYRITGDPAILSDVDGTLRLFERFFRDEEQGGYFSHVDPVDLSPHAASLGPNRSRKNWNSVGDHAPAYLVNLFLATGEARHADMLERTFDDIVARFPDPRRSPFVQERFHSDWSADTAWGWQQDRAVVGHNLKIAWNLMRMQALRPKGSYRALAAQIAHQMPAIGNDRQRGGWYDVLERARPDGERWHRFTWHDRKAWWQQEQAILAYLLLSGYPEEPEFLRQAREAQSFYNAYFLDHDEGGVYFNVLANGMPYLLGNERSKGSHAMSLYHKAELAYLATVYNRLLLFGEPLPLWFRPHPGGLPGRILRVMPDLLPPGRVRLASVEVDGARWRDFDPFAGTVQLPDTTGRVTVRATLEPVRPRWGHPR